MDLTTPYGYGGPLVEGEYNKNSILKFVKEMELYCRKNNIVSQFFRFAPWMNNQSVLEGACKKILLKKLSIWILDMMWILCVIWILKTGIWFERH